PVCPDWVFLNNSNVNVATDRGWFKTYTPFTSTVNDSSPIFASSSALPVLGIGTVEIYTKRSPNLSGISSHGSLLLAEVLHVPGFICNAIGQPMWDLDDYGVTTGGSRGKSKGAITNSQGKNMAYFDPSRPLFVLKVRADPKGPKLGPPVLQHGTMYALGCQWSETEVQKWQKFKAENGLINPKPELASVVNKNPPYTQDEKAFLKKHFRSEYHFLNQHGLHINKEEDRAEGRLILRAFEEADDESDPEAHLADYNFTEDELNWIEKHFKNSKQFMICYGLKFYKDDDLEEAKHIAELMMADDD
ncbi:hypothetical protein IQ07DRAFT_478719, partial [Pyrenochaeta sp. DS3sAY3a]